MNNYDQRSKQLSRKVAIPHTHTTLLPRPAEKNTTLLAKNLFAGYRGKLNSVSLAQPEPFHALTPHALAPPSPSAAGERVSSAR